MSLRMLVVSMLPLAFFLLQEVVYYSLGTTRTATTHEVHEYSSAWAHGVGRSAYLLVPATRARSPRFALSSSTDRPHRTHSHAFMISLTPSNLSSGGLWSVASAPPNSGASSVVHTSRCQRGRSCLFASLGRGGPDCLAWPRLLLQEPTHEQIQLVI